MHFTTTQKQWGRHRGLGSVQHPASILCCFLGGVVFVHKTPHGTYSNGISLFFITGKLKFQTISYVTTKTSLCNSLLIPIFIALYKCSGGKPHKQHRNMARIYTHPTQPKVDVPNLDLISLLFGTLHMPNTHTYLN